MTLSPTDAGPTAARLNRRPAAPYGRAGSPARVIDPRYFEISMKIGSANAFGAGGVVSTYVVLLPSTQ